MINVAGNNVYPKELERFLKLNDNVLTVEVFSRDSNIQGKIVGLKVRLGKNGVDDQNNFKMWCFKNISQNKLPKIWDFM